MDMPTLWQIMKWLRRKKQRRPNIFRILWRPGMVNSNATTVAHREKTDLLLQPPLAEVDMLNWKAFDRAIALGYEYTVRRLAALPKDAPILSGAAQEPS
jgi:NTE family protein